MACCKNASSAAIFTVCPRVDLYLASNTCVTCVGDDPNYWIAATISAETQYMKKKVQRMLAEINGDHLAKEVSW